MRKLLTAVQWVLFNISCGTCGSSMTWNGREYVCPKCG